jgi:hypothetical protein
VTEQDRAVWAAQEALVDRLPKVRPVLFRLPGLTVTCSVAQVLCSLCSSVQPCAAACCSPSSGGVGHAMTAGAAMLACCVVLAAHASCRAPILLPFDSTLHYCLYRIHCIRLQALLADKACRSRYTPCRLNFSPHLLHCFQQLCRMHLQALFAGVLEADKACRSRTCSSTLCACRNNLKPRAISAC